MRHAKPNAYRSTDLTIVVIGLACATVLAAVGIFSRMSTLERGDRPANAGGGHCQPLAQCDRVAPASGATIQRFGAGGGG